jgi:endonuclease/exonuclease/phosphatase family metal-dependent hydrolase
LARSVDILTVDKMKLVAYNIRFGLGLDQRVDLGRIAETVRDADIIGLQEVERFWKHSGMSDQPDILGRHLKEFYWLPDPPERSPGRGLTLDYCFVGPELGRKVKRAWVDRSAKGSDHRPSWVELDLSIARG